jgi:GTP diphosphokinase / guanosine-3',5'-bis(diphosphate) 3'-diphosphatase
MMQLEANRIVEVGWPSDNGVVFVAGVKVSGTDRPAMLNDITHAISAYMNTNIRSVNLDSHDSLFDGTFIIYVKDTDHLNRLLERIRRVKGVTRADRFEE